jgi:hypothetical protein
MPAAACSVGVTCVTSDVSHILGPQLASPRIPTTLPTPSPTATHVAALRASAPAGPRSITRTAQALDAVLSVARETLQQLQSGGAPDAPPVVLRRLFERLGATYIKLGQFIASSPTIFPPEYVLEFQKCLDQTTPVPFDVIRCAMRAVAPGASRQGRHPPNPGSPVPHFPPRRPPLFS